MGTKRRPSVNGPFYLAKLPMDLKQKEGKTDIQVFNGNFRFGHSGNWWKVNLVYTTPPPNLRCTQLSPSLVVALGYVYAIRANLRLLLLFSFPFYHIKITFNARP